MKLTQNISYMCFKLSSTGSPCSKLVYKMSFVSAHFQAFIVSVLLVGTDNTTWHKDFPNSNPA